MVFSDEYSYAAWTYHLYHDLPKPELAPEISNWAYLRLYEYAHVGQGDFLASARVLNALFAALSAGFAYAMCRKWSDGLVACFGGLTYSILLVGNYVPYFMPEAMYFAASAMLAWAMASYALKPKVALLVVVAVVGGLTATIKAHGLLLLPAMVVGVFWLGLAHRKRLSRVATDIVILTMTWWLTSLLVGGLFGGTWSLNPLGGFYTDVASGSASEMNPDRLPQVLDLARRHFLTVMLVAGVPVIFSILFCLRVLLSWRGSSADDKKFSGASVAMLCAFAGMLLVTIVFTVTQANPGPYETLDRLHGRYYEHLLVLVALLGAIAAPRLLMPLRPYQRWVIAAAMLVLLFGAYIGTAGIGWQNFNDFSVAYGLFAGKNIRYAACVIWVASVVFAVAAPRKSHVALMSGLAVWLLLNAFAMEKLRYSLQDRTSDRLSEVIAMAESGGDRAKVLVVSPDYNADMYRIAFQLLSEDVTIQVGQQQPVACPSGDGQWRWIVTLGDLPMPCDASSVLQLEGQSLGRPLDQAAPVE